MNYLQARMVGMLVLLAFASIAAAASPSNYTQRRGAVRAQAQEEIPPGSVAGSPSQVHEGDAIYEGDYGGDFGYDGGYPGNDCLSGCCCPTPLYWGSLDYLLWWTPGQKLPPLVTTSTDPADAGILGQDTTSILFGGDRVDEDSRSGGRAVLGKWLDPQQELGMAGKFYGLGDSSTSFSRVSNGTPLLANPFIDATTGDEDSYVFAFPENFSGNVRVQTGAELLGGDAFFRKLVHRDCCTRVDLLMGYQFARINEFLRITSNRTAISGDDLGTVTTAQDQFRTQNSFQGAAMGLMTEHNRGCWTTQAVAKLGVGVMQQTIRVNGQTTVAVPDDPVDIRTGGIYAQASNIGTRSQDAIAVVPEFNLNLAYHVTPRFDLVVGYTFIYWSSVVRPGDQIDRVISLPDANGDQDEQRPAPRFNATDYWAQGLNFGAQWRW